MATMRLRCNVGECQAMRQGKRDVSLAQLRAQLVEVGWYVDADADLDLCPPHAADYVERVL